MDTGLFRFLLSSPFLFPTTLKIYLSLGSATLTTPLQRPMAQFRQMVIWTQWFTITNLVLRRVSKFYFTPNTKLTLFGDIDSDILIHQDREHREWMFNLDLTEDGKYLVLYTSKDTSRVRLIIFAPIHPSHTRDRKTNFGLLNLNQIRLVPISSGIRSLTTTLLNMMCMFFFISLLVGRFNSITPPAFSTRALFSIFALTMRLLVTRW